MGHQGALPPYAVGSETSYQAAESMQQPAAVIRQRVFKAVAATGFSGFTCDEVEVSLGLRHQTASARINELHRAGTIVDSQRRRKTRSGRNAVVWIVAPPRGKTLPLFIS